VSPTGGPAGVPSPPGSSRSGTRAVVELVAAVAAITLLAVLGGWVDLLVVVACLVVMVMLHELGHLLAAKRGGMKVTEYFLGFGPRLWSFRHGETEYGVKAFPVGGYVKIPGMTNLEEVDPADEPRTYRQQSFPKRLLVAVAGSATHFLIAIVLLWVLAAFVGVPNDHQLAVQSLDSVGGRAGPAQVAGIRPGDVIVSVDGHAIGGDFDRFSSLVRSHAGQSLPVVVQRDGHDVLLAVVPANARTLHEAGVQTGRGSAPYGVIGVSANAPLDRRNPLVSVGWATVNLGVVAKGSLVGLGHVFSPGGLSQLVDQVTNAQVARHTAANGTRLYSIVGAARGAAQAVHYGVGDLLVFLVAINVFIGLLNLFPMLPFDGGHVAIAVYERIRSGRRRVAYHADVAKLLPFTSLTIALIGVLFVTTLLADVLHPASPFG
jgi:membrane-associated protease RseP (regulator of RpoE activity)